MINKKNKINNGVDIIEVDRIIKASRNPRFMNRVFSLYEREFFDSKKNPFQSMAANFAGKEAFAKAIKTGIFKFPLNEVSILRDENGAPYIYLTGKALDLARGFEFSISISHTENLACASVVAYSE